MCLSDLPGPAAQPWTTVTTKSILATSKYCTVYLSHSLLSDAVFQHISQQRRLVPAITHSPHLYMHAVSFQFTLDASYLFHCCTLFQCAPRVNKFSCYFNNSELKIFIYICASYTAYKNNLCPWFMAPPGQVIALRLGSSPLATIEQDMFA
jgi:hypothetical protein